MVQGLRLLAFNAESMGSILGQGAKIPHATKWNQKRKIIFFKKQIERKTRKKKKNKDKNFTSFHLTSLVLPIELTNK